MSLDIVCGVIKLLKVQKGVHAVFPIQASNLRHKTSPDTFTQARVASNSRVPPSRVRTVKVDYDKFLDFHVDSVEK